MTITEMTRATMFKNIFYQLRDLMENLECRWRFESEYEDIKDYQAVIEKKVATIKTDGSCFTIIKMLKKPFGFECVFDGAVYKVTQSSKFYQYKRIG